MFYNKNTMSRLDVTEQNAIDAKIATIKAKTGKNYPNNSLLEIIHAYLPELEVKEFDFGEDSSKIKGAIKYPDGSNPVILINEKQITETGRNFTLAHEFAHYVLHEKQEKFRFRLDLFDYKADTTKSKQETEANYFAASLLMPKNEFEELSKLTSDKTKIAEYFGVSVPAIETRIKWLNQNK